MSEFVPVLNLSELALGQSKAVSVFEKSVLLCHSSEGIYAIANECSHQKRPLEGGRIRGKSIFCPTHGARFDLETGMPKGQLTKQAIATYTVRVVADVIEIA